MITQIVTTNSDSARFIVGSLYDTKDRSLAAQKVANGEVIGVFNRGVNALWINGADPKAVAKLHQIKGEGRKGRPVALTIGLDSISKIIDFSVINQEVREFIQLTEDLKDTLGSLCFLRVPIKKEFEALIPNSSTSTDDNGRIWIQTWDPYGHKPTELLLDEFSKLGIDYPAVSSMNISGEPEIVDQDQAEKFCKDNNINMYLRDPHAHPELIGSYTIISLGEEGIELIRDGNIPSRMIEPIFGREFIKTQTKQSNHKQREFPETLINNLTPKQIRLAILLYLEGKDPIEINKSLLK